MIAPLGIKQKAGANRLFCFRRPLQQSRYSFTQDIG